VETRVQGAGFSVETRVQGAGFSVETRVQGAGFSVETRVQSIGFRVLGGQCRTVPEPCTLNPVVTLNPEP